MSWIPFDPVMLRRSRLHSFLFFFDPPRPSPESKASLLLPNLCRRPSSGVAAGMDTPPPSTWLMASPTGAPWRFLSFRPHRNTTADDCDAPAGRSNPPVNTGVPAPYLRHGRRPSAPSNTSALLQPDYCCGSSI